MPGWSDLRLEQIEDIEWLRDRTEALLTLPVGYGKTVVALSAFAWVREKAEFESGARPPRALVVSTKNIIQLTWGQEIALWSHLPKLSYASAAGRKRKAVESMPDVLGINFESLEWLYDLVERDLLLLPEVLIIDESSKMKSHSTRRVRRHCGLRGWVGQGFVSRFSHRWALSATPAAEGYVGLWAQEACISNERRLGANITTFRSQYCDARWNGVAMTYSIGKESEKRIEQALAPILRASRRDKYSDLPDPVHSILNVPWSEKARGEYDRLESDFMLDIIELMRERGLASDLAQLEGLEEGAELNVLAPSIAVLLNKLRQASSGFIYDAEKRAHALTDGDAKLKALEDVVERSGEVPLVVFIQYLAEAEAIRSRIPGAVVGLPKSLDGWNAGKIPMLVLHPKSAGHGINLQHGSHIAVWYSLPWGYEDWHQANGRLDRTGQTRQVSIIRMRRPDSIDDYVWKNLAGKGATLSRFISSIRERRSATCLG